MKEEKVGRSWKDLLKTVFVIWFSFVTDLEDRTISTKVFPNFCSHSKISPSFIVFCIWREESARVKSIEEELGEAKIEFRVEREGGENCSKTFKKRKEERKGLEEEREETRAKRREGLVSLHSISSFNFLCEGS